MHFFCALIGNIDKLESLKASATGFEAKTREIAQVIDEARVTIKEFYELAEMTGSIVIELMARNGRIGGTPPNVSDRWRSRVLDTLSNFGLSPAAIKRVKSSDTYLVMTDYAFGILQGILKSESCSPQLKAAALQMRNNWSEGDDHLTPENFDRLISGGSCTDIHILELVKDYRYYHESGEHRRRDVWLARRNWPR